MSKFLNVTNHQLTAAQLQDIINNGFEVVELPPELKTQWGQLNVDNWRDAVEAVWSFICKEEVEAAMIAGYAPAVFNLVNQSDRAGVEALYADTARESIETTLEDGSVRKTAVFKHKGFYSQVTGERW